MFDQVPVGPVRDGLLAAESAQVLPFRGISRLLRSRKPYGAPPRDRRQPSRFLLVFPLGLNGAGRRSGKFSGFHPTMLRAHRRAC